ncbi:2-hydroxychromene-2-carboxylate isomerase [Novosphingobium aquimarinum]|uniref:2-hydroxychromene-2-carboxylate isomerase n=1 Tax=Novosphingobium aquimarinum TaxID=2682494 RepID=UPI0012EB9CC6|nr:2-hydroxychromene-2-carboxylate isomerase [Novosphingobium aquimarinum]
MSQGSPRPGRTAVEVYFNFRSPYCYLASKSLFDVIGRFDVDLVWRPLGGWNGRSPPERAAEKLPLARQDVSRWCARMGIPFCPPPKDTEPTAPALLSLAAQEAGLLRPFVEAVMHAEWGEGLNIGQTAVLEPICASVGLGPDVLEAALANADYARVLDENWSKARVSGVVGVPSFVVEDEVFWGNDRLDFLSEHLATLGPERG